MSQKTLVSGVQASGALHIGNYFGSMRQNISLTSSGEYESFVFIADYHALTTTKDRETLKENVLDAACAYLALGFDPSKGALFRQSSLSEHTELAWIFNTVVTMPYLMRAHAFKDHEAKQKEVNVGLFDYPVLMAADILIYKGDIVPVGKDQQQHIEYARDIAGYFNRTWGEYFTLPESYILEDVAVVPGIDGEKMSKSKGNGIPLFGTDEEIEKAVMAIVTDSAAPSDPKEPDTNNIFNIHKLFLSDEETAELSKRYKEGGLGYKEAKQMLLESIKAFVSPKRDLYHHYQSNREEVERILEEGATLARAKAHRTMKEVRDLVGLH